MFSGSWKPQKWSELLGGRQSPEPSFPGREGGVKPPGEPCSSCLGQFQAPPWYAIKGQASCAAVPAGAGKHGGSARRTGCSQVAPGAHSILLAGPGFSPDPRPGSPAQWGQLTCWWSEAPASSTCLLLTPIISRQDGPHAEGQDGSERSPVLPVSMSHGDGCVLGSARCLLSSLFWEEQAWPRGAAAPQEGWAAGH